MGKHAGSTLALRGAPEQAPRATELIDRTLPKTANLRNTQASNIASVSVRRTSWPRVATLFGSSSASTTAPSKLATSDASAAPLKEWAFHRDNGRAVALHQLRANNRGPQLAPAASPAAGGSRRELSVPAFPWCTGLFWQVLGCHPLFALIWPGLDPLSPAPRGGGLGSSCAAAKVGKCDSLHAGR